MKDESDKQKERISHSSGISHLDMGMLGRQSVASPFLKAGTVRHEATVAQ